MTGIKRWRRVVFDAELDGSGSCLAGNLGRNSKPKIDAGSDTVRDTRMGVEARIAGEARHHGHLQSIDRHHAGGVGSTLADPFDRGISEYPLTSGRRRVHLSHPIHRAGPRLYPRCAVNHVDVASFGHAMVAMISRCRPAVSQDRNRRGGACGRDRSSTAEARANRSSPLE